MLVGWGLAKRHRRRAIVGPQWGAVKWLGAFGIPITLLASVWAFQGATLAVRLPQLIGLLFGPLVYALVLEASDHQVEQFLFRHQDLQHAKSPRGEDSYDSRYITHIVKRGVRREAAGEIVLIEKGLMPYIARLRGNLAVLDITEVETHKQARGPYALEIELDPEHEPYAALLHEPPTVERRALVERVDLPGLGETDLPNPAVIGPLGIGAAAGWFLADATLGLPAVGAVAGFVVALPFIHYIEEGGAEAEPAPYHFTQAEASLAAEGEAYADAKAIDEYRSVAWRERMKTPMEAERVMGEFDETVTQKLNESRIGEYGLDSILDDSDGEATGGTADDD
jgi:hypothetical protein